METIALKIGEIYTHENGARIKCIKNESSCNCCFCCLNPILYNDSNNDIDNELTLIDCKNVKCTSNERAEVGLEEVDVHFKRIKDNDSKQEDDNTIINPFKYYTNRTI